jgi:hypothetical protein
LQRAAVKVETNEVTRELHSNQAESKIHKIDDLGGAETCSHGWRTIIIRCI